MNISTERLTIRPVTRHDIDFIHQLHSLPETDRYNTLGLPATIDDTAATLEGWLQEQQAIPAKRYTWIIENIEAEFVGLAGIIMGKPKYLLADLWYKIHPDSWRKGYATEVVQHILKFAFKELHLHRIEAGCAVENTASARVMEKAGMKREGLRRKVLPIRGSWADAYSYAILDEDYLKM